MNIHKRVTIALGLIGATLGLAACNGGDSRAARPETRQRPDRPCRREASR